jgi:hypothetical protein
VFLVSVVCCHLVLTATGPSPGQRSPTDSGVSKRDREASKMRKP